VCELFSCCWLEGAFLDRHFPKKAGVIVTMEDTEDLGRVWCVYEREPGVTKTKRAAREILEALRTTSVPVALIPSHDGQRLLYRNDDPKPWLYNRPGEGVRCPKCRRMLSRDPKIGDAMTCRTCRLVVDVKPPSRMDE
jgi:hypothetical protein